MHGLDTYIDQQLTPLTWSDEGDYRMRSASEELFTLYRPGHDTYLIVDGDRWDLKKGTEAPISGTSQGSKGALKKNGWLNVPSGFGYSSSRSERDLLSTLLNDMERIEEGEEAQGGLFEFFCQALV